jgi:dipeptidyl aminopeptidase/acylaminoacyl peptidase
MDRSPRNGFRLAHYPDPEAIPEAIFGPRSPLFAFDFRAEAPIDDAAFQIYREQFAYDPAPVNGAVDQSWVSEGGWTHEVVSFDAAYGGERVLGHLFLPENVPPPYQTVVYFPGDASKMMPSSEGLEDYYEFEMFLSYLVRTGRAVFYPVYKGTFERGGPEYLGVLQVRQNWGSYAYAELLVQILKDLRRSIDYLETRPEIDADRLAYYGMSWGGFMGAIIPAIEDRFQTSVLIAAGLTGIGRPEVRDLTYVHRVQIPTLILNGKYDVVFSPETQAIPLFDLLGTPPADKRLMLFETDHIPPRTEYIKETLAWLDRYLEPVRR